MSNAPQAPGLVQAKPTLQGNIELACYSPKDGKKGESSSTAAHDVDPHNEEVVNSAMVETWKSPRRNLWRYLLTLFSLFMLGANDACIGVLLPHIEKYYQINYTLAATLFLSPMAGYTLSAVLINRIHLKFGQLGIVIISSSSKALTYAITCVHPHFAVIPAVFVFAAFGNGLQDGAWSAWAGGLGHANELLGVLHGAYGVGAAVAPVVATSMVVTGGLQWYTFYYLMLAGAVTELIAGVAAFWSATGSKFRDDNNICTRGETIGIKAIFGYKVTWIIATFLFLYLGAEVAVGGWIVTYMLEIRQGSTFACGMVATGFWLGLTAGRIFLGFATGRIGVKLAVTIYLLFAIGAELLFWLIPSFLTSAIFVAFLGFFFGPLFPAGIVVITQLLPSYLHVNAVAFVVAVGATGAAVMPFVVGAITEAKGVQVLGAIVLSLILAFSLLWCCLPGGFKRFKK